MLRDDGRGLDAAQLAAIFDPILHGGRPEGLALTRAYALIRERLGPFDLVMLEVGAFHPSWGDIHLGNDLLMLAAPDIAHVSPVFTGLIAAGALAAALSTADGLLLTISNSLAHDVYPPSRIDSANPLRRVMLSKVLLMLVALVAALVATYRPVDILFWVACAFSLAASTFFRVTKKSACLPATSLPW